MYNIFYLASTSIKKKKCPKINYSYQNSTKKNFSFWYKWQIYIWIKTKMCFSKLHSII